MSNQPGASPMNLRMTVYCALFTTLIIIGSYIAIPIGPVPIVLADFMVMLAGLFLGWRWGLSSVMLWLFLGALGLPVFAGGKAGLAVFMGPTAGFLLGYVLLVLAIGIIAGSGKPSIPKVILGLVVGNVLMYPPGILWLKTTLSMDWSVAIGVGLTPFLPGLLVKAVVIVILAKTLLPNFRQNVSDIPFQSTQTKDI